MTPANEPDLHGRDLSDEDVAKTHPGFTVTCGKCGSSRVIVDDTRGWSAESGRWGSLRLWCLKCGQETPLTNADED